MSEVRERGVCRPMIPRHLQGFDNPVSLPLCGCGAGERWARGGCRQARCSRIQGIVLHSQSVFVS